MNEHDPMDLSALHPMRDPAHWRAVVDATLVRVDAVLSAPPQDPLTLIASWTRSLVIAGAVVIALLVPVEIALETREARAEQVQRLVTLSADWGYGEPPPSGSDFLRALTEGGQP